MLKVQRNVSMKYLLLLLAGCMTETPAPVPAPVINEFHYHFRISGAAPEVHVDGDTVKFPPGMYQIFYSGENSIEVRRVYQSDSLMINGSGWRYSINNDSLWFITKEGDTLVRTTR